MLDKYYTYFKKREKYYPYCPTWNPQVQCSEWGGSLKRRRGQEKKARVEAKKRRGVKVRKSITHALGGDSRDALVLGILCSLV